METIWEFARRPKESTIIEAEEPRASVNHHEWAVKIIIQLEMWNSLHTFYIVFDSRLVIQEVHITVWLLFVHFLKCVIFHWTISSGTEIFIEMMDLNQMTFYLQQMFWENSVRFLRQCTREAMTKKKFQ